MYTVKEEFLNHPKTRRAIKAAGWDAVGLWMAMKAYCAIERTDGFVPDDEIEMLHPDLKGARKLLKALVVCGKKRPGEPDGPGLVEQVEGGWQLHDYLDHARSADEEEDRRRKERERKAAWRRNRTNGTSDGTCVPECPRDSDGTWVGQ
jgi:hypothetical protein